MLSTGLLTHKSDFAGVVVCEYRVGWLGLKLMAGDVAASELISFTLPSGPDVIQVWAASE